MSREQFPKLPMTMRPGERPPELISIAPTFEPSMLRDGIGHDAWTERLWRVWRGCPQIAQVTKGDLFLDPETGDILKIENVGKDKGRPIGFSTVPANRLETALYWLRIAPTIKVCDPEELGTP